MEDNPLGIRSSQKKVQDMHVIKKKHLHQKPPYFDGFDLNKTPKIEFINMRPLAFFGDSVTTDHISPAGAFKANSPAGQYLLSLGVPENEFNIYGSRREIITS